MKICQVCGASFVSKGNLKQHMEAIHEKKRDFACNVCDAKFYFKHKMEEHVKGMNLDFLILFGFTDIQRRQGITYIVLLSDLTI